MPGSFEHAEDDGIARGNAGENRVSIFQSGTNNCTSNSLRSFKIKIQANVADNTDVKVG